MPRPLKPRAIRHEPAAVHFKPAGVPLRMLEEVSLGRDELEALRLADLEDLSHEEVGGMMNVSRATVGRILAEARRKVAVALVHGHSIRVEGGVVETIDDDGQPCPRGRRAGKARGGCRGRGHGPGGGHGRRRGVGPDGKSEA